MLLVDVVVVIIATGGANDVKQPKNTYYAATARCSTVLARLRVASSEE